MINDNYFLLMQTAPSEFQAWDELGKKFSNRGEKLKIVPIVEFTRGRKVPFTNKFYETNQNFDPSDDKFAPEYLKRLMREKGIFNYDKNIEYLQTKFKECESVILDATREEAVTCYEIEELISSDNNYQNWVDFVLEQEQHFENLIPVIQVNPAEGCTAEDFEVSVISQFEHLASNFNSLAYRASITSDINFFNDLSVLSDQIQNYCRDERHDFIIIFDYEFINPGTWVLHAKRLST